MDPKFNFKTKVVTQLVKLEYTGMSVRKKRADISRMNALLGITTGNVTATEGPKTSYSYLIASYSEDEKDNDVPVALSFNVEACLTRLSSFEDPKARALKDEFFASVEEGKRQLLEKYGSEVAFPKEEIAALSARLKGKGGIVWKTHIITTVSSKVPFEGGRPNKDGLYVASVKSKTIYTMVPILESQVKELKEAFQSKMVEVGNRSNKVYYTNGKMRGYQTASGHVIFREVDPNQLE